MKLLYLYGLSIFFYGHALAQGTGMQVLHAKRGIHKGIYDKNGNRVILRGVNYNALGDYWQALPDVPSSKLYSDSDIELMAQQGFNCIRLIFSWSALEPERGKYDRDYIAKIARAVETAAGYNMYVLVDMHQDAWGKYVATTGDEKCPYPARGWDGAPAWATFTDRLPTCPARGSRESAPAVVCAFSHFWDDTDSIQSACIDAWQQVIKAVAPYPNVAGYDLINEPGLGTRTLFKESRLMARYYKKLVKAIRNTERQNGFTQHTVYFENSVTWRGKEIPSVPFTSFSGEKNIVFAPHHYFGSLTNKLNIKQGFGFLKFFANLYHTDMFIGEWGFFSSADTLKLKQFAAAEDKMLIGSTWWQWAQACGDPHSIHWEGAKWVAPDRSMHLIELDRQARFTGKMNEPFLHILSRARLVSYTGKVSGLISGPDSKSMFVKGHVKRNGLLKIWIPGRFGQPAINGSNILHTDVAAIPGGYMAEVRVKGKYCLYLKY